MNEANIDRAVTAAWDLNAHYANPDAPDWLRTLASLQEAVHFAYDALTPGEHVRVQKMLSLARQMDAFTPEPAGIAWDGELVIPGAWVDQTV